MKELNAITTDYIRKVNEDFGAIFDFEDSKEDSIIRFSLKLESDCIKCIKVFVKDKDKSDKTFKLFYIIPLQHCQYNKTNLMELSKDMQINLIEFIIKYSIFYFCIEYDYSVDCDLVNRWSRGFANKFCENYLKDIKKPILREVLDIMNSEFVEISDDNGIETISGDANQLLSLDDYYLQFTVESITAGPDIEHDIKIYIKIK